jgi:hypothetical protein
VTQISAAPSRIMIAFLMRPPTDGVQLVDRSAKPAKEARIDNTEKDVADTKRMIYPNHVADLFDAPCHS